MTTFVPDRSGNGSGVGFNSPSGNTASVVTGQSIISSTGVPVRLPSLALANGAIIKASIANSGPVMVGSGNVTTAIDGSGTGYILQPGEAASFGVTNLAGVYFNGTAGAIVTYEGN